MKKLPSTPDFLPAAGRDSLLPTYDLTTRLMGVPRLHRALIRQADLRDGQQVLEIGCGTGNLSALAAPIAHLTATDPDDKALDRARHKVDNARFERAYVQDLPFPDATFDTVLSALMLHHLAPEAKVRGFSELFRVLKQGGSLHVVDITAHGVLAHGAKPHFTDDLVALLNQAGFEARELAQERRLFLGQITFIEAKK